MNKPLNTLINITTESIRDDPPATAGGYRFPTPRLALGIGSVAITAITLSVSVLLPAWSGTANPGARLVAASKVLTPASVGTATVTTIDVVAHREPAPSMRNAAIGDAHARGLVVAALPAVIRLSSNVE